MLSLCVGSASAQLTQETVFVFNTPPSGACAYAPLVKVSNQGTYQCVGNVWTLIGPGGGSGGTVDTVARAAAAAAQTTANTANTAAGAAQTTANNANTAAGAAQTTANAALPSAGGTLTGPLALAADPTTALQAATKQYVDANAGGGGGSGLTGMTSGQVPVANSATTANASKAIAGVGAGLATTSITGLSLGAVPIYTDALGTLGNSGVLYTSFARVNSSQQTALSTKTANYTVTNADQAIMCDATAGSITMTLPATIPVGNVFNIKKIDSSVNTCTVSGNGHNIDGAATLVLLTQYMSTAVQGGVQWWVR